MKKKFKIFGKPLYALHTEDTASFTNDTVIHTGAYFSNCFIDKNNNISGKGFVFFNVQYDSNVLLYKSVEFGQMLYETYSSKFNIDFKYEKIDDVYVSDGDQLVSTSIKTKLKSIEKLFIKWFSITGCPSQSITTLKSKKIKITLPLLEDLRNKYIILYQMYTIFYNLNSLIYGITNFDNNSEQDDKDLIKSEENLNKILINLNLETFEIDYQNLDQTLKKLFQLKSTFLYRIQQFSDYFRIQITPYISTYLNTANNFELQSKIVNTSENLFDLAWNILINETIYNNKFENICTCKCGSIFIQNHKKTTKCEKCRQKEQLSKSQLEREERKKLINEICSFKDSLIIKNKTAQKYLNEIIDLTAYGMSRKKDSFSIPILREYKNYILKNSKAKIKE